MSAIFLAVLGLYEGFLPSRGVCSLLAAGAALQRLLPITVEMWTAVLVPKADTSATKNKDGKPNVVCIQGADGGRRAHLCRHLTRARTRTSQWSGGHQQAG